MGYESRTANKLQIPAHGGHLHDLVVSETKATSLKKAAVDYPRITLNQRQLCDLELLLNGAYSPLTGFMNQSAYNSVLDNLHLPDNTLWPMPVVLDISKAQASKLKLTKGSTLALQDGEGFMLAVLNIDDIWQPDKTNEAKQVYGTTSTSHPGVQYLMETTQELYIGGVVQGIQLPDTHVFEIYRQTPKQLRAHFVDKGWRKIIAFQTSKIIHRLQRDILLSVAKQNQGNLLIHPTIGSTKPGDTHYYTRVHCYEAVLKHFPKQLVMMSLLPLSMRMAGARESLWYAIIQQNFGCTHCIVGPNHAEPPQANLADSQELSYHAQALISTHQGELQIQMIPVEEYQYNPSTNQFDSASNLKKSAQNGIKFSAAKIQSSLHENKTIPSWCSFDGVVSEMRKAYPPRNKQGFTLFFTGLSGSGKSTLAKTINAQLIEQGPRFVTLLDGDVVRLNLSSELGFSKPHRDLNIRRIGFVANEITKNGGIAICAPIAPYTKSRREVRELIEQHGAFIEIYVSTPLKVCESRDRKGLYVKARQGLIPEFTGISDPYQTPQQAELTIDTSQMGSKEAAQKVMLYLLNRGFLDPQ